MVHDEGPGSMGNPSVHGGFTRAVVLAAHLLELRLDHLLHPMGLSTRQYLLLCAIDNFPGVGRAGLSRRLGLSPQAVGGMATRLNASGWIDISALVRGRPTTYNLTPQGLVRLQRARTVLADAERDLALALPGASIDQLSRDLVDLASTMISASEGVGQCLARNEARDGAHR